MTTKAEFDPMAYAARIMRGKGYDPEASDEWADIFEIQWPYWQELFAKHRLDADPEKAEQLLKSFMPREVKGGASKILETFGTHLDAQPKQGGSPDWSKAGKEWRECAYCDGRGVVSNIPVEVERRGEILQRIYSFACVCDRGKFFAGMKVASDWMLTFAADRKLAEIAGHETVLRRYGIDPNASAAVRAGQYRRAIQSMRKQVGQSGITARNVQPILPQTVEQARNLLASRKKTPPPRLDPEAVALSVFDNGDERNEWE